MAFERFLLYLRTYIINMIRLFYTILAFCVAIFAANAQNNSNVNKDKKRPTVALVLAGGGAKGMAHLGAIKVIESCGIPIDIIVGTSMGSIVGGLYSIGYTSDELLEIARETDWLNLILDKPDFGSELLTAKKNNENFLLRVSLDRSRVLSSTGGGGIIDGRNISLLFNHLTDGLPDNSDFSKFPIRFACVATNAVTGEKHVFHEGNLVTAMRSSMAIPSVFTPVKVGDATLVDGFVVDNYPVDVARDMGADIIIGVDLVTPMTEDQLANSAFDIMMRMLDFNSMELYKANKEDTDIYIPVNTEGYTAASFSAAAIDSLIERGKEAAVANIDSLYRLAEHLGIDQSAGVSRTRMSCVNYCTSNADVHKEIYDEADEDVSIIKTDSLGMIDFTETLKSSYHFAKHVFQHGALSLGCRFDNQEYAAMQLSIDARLLRRSMIDLNIYGRLGARMVGGISMAHIFKNESKIESGYSFAKKDMSCYFKGFRIADLSDYHQRFIMRYKKEYNKVGYSLGLRYDVDRYRNLLFHKDVAVIAPDLNKEKYFTYFVKAEFNNLDSQYFPTRGTQTEAKAELISSNLYEFHNYAMFPVFTFKWRTSFSPNRRFSFIPHASTRIICPGDAHVPFALKNFFGGLHNGLMKDQQMEVAGVPFLEIVDSKAVNVAGFDLQQRMGGNHFIVAKFDAMSLCNNIDHALDKEALFWGCNLGYHYRGVAGPISLIGTWSNRTKETGIILNVGYYF